MYDINLIIIGVVAAIISSIVRGRLKSVMNKLSQIPLSRGLSGRDVAQKMLEDNGIYDVQIISTAGQLTDHYNPAKRTVNLSEIVYGERSIAAAAVAAHEVGHAVQHKTSYSFLQFRSNLVPFVSFASKYATWIILAGLFLMQFPVILLAGIVLYGAGVLFSLITLPVEFDASQRAVAWLEQSGVARGEELEHAKNGLKWAAMTYVVAALTALATLLYYIMIFMGRRD